MALGCSMRGACRSIVSASISWRIQGRSLIRGMYVCSHVCIKILGYKIINNCLALDLSVIAT
jgi:hypothetical protein